MTDFETLILNQTQDQMQHMWFQFRPFGEQRKYNELDKTTKYVVDTYIRHIHENIEKMKKNPHLQKRLIDLYNDYFNEYGLECEVKANA